MRTRTYTDTYATLAARVAARILASGVVNENERGVRELQTIAAGDSARTDYMYVEFERANRAVSCTLYMRADTFGRGDRGDRDELPQDADGNSWATYRVTFDVSWPAHGTTSLAAATARVDLYREVVALANRLQAEFTLVDALEDTRAAREEREAKREAARVARAVLLTVGERAKGLKVGGFTGVFQVPTDGDLAVPVGEHICVTAADRVYKLVVKALDEDPTKRGMLVRLENKA